MQHGRFAELITFIAVAYTSVFERLRIYMSRERYSELESKRLVQESEQSRPVALGGGWVEDGHIRNRKAMTCTGISLDQMVHPGLGQSLFEAVLLFFGERLASSIAPAT